MLGMRLLLLGNRVLMLVLVLVLVHRHGSWRNMPLLKTEPFDGLLIERWAKSLVRVL